MAKYEYLHGMVTSCGIKKECLLKRTAGQNQAFVQMPAIDKQTGESIIIFPQDEVRIFGNEPASEHIIAQWQEWMIVKKKKQLQFVEDFFKRKPSFWKRIWYFFSG